MKQQSKLEFIVGLFVLLGLIAVAYLTIKIGSGSLFGGPTYKLEARFTNVSGLNAGSSIVVAGVTVGKVDAIRVDPEDFSAIVEFVIDAGIKLSTDSMASIKTSGLIGDKYILLAPGADDTYLQPGERITMTESTVDIESLIGKIAFGGVNGDASGDETPETPDEPAPSTPSSESSPVENEINPQTKSSDLVP